MFIINAKIKIDESKRNDYLKMMEELVKNSNQEEGVLFYQHYEDVSERNSFVVVENYKDEQAMRHHNDSDHFKTFSQHISDYIIEKPVVDVSQTIEK